MASEEEASLVLKANPFSLNIEEKIDGSSVGFTFHDGHGIIRNRDHILGKGFMRKKNDTTAKMQFRSIWTWFDRHKDKFLQICEHSPFSIYGEWMVAQHGIFYDRLPDWFIAYDIYNYETNQFLAPRTARRLLQEAGFNVPDKIEGEVESYEDLVDMANGPATWADGKREGIYLKVCDNETVTHRFKMVREDFQRGALWDNKEMKKNELVEKKLAAIR